MWSRMPGTTSTRRSQGHRQQRGSRTCGRLLLLSLLGYRATRRRHIGNAHRLSKPQQLTMIAWPRLQLDHLALCCRAIRHRPAFRPSKSIAPHPGEGCRWLLRRIELQRLRPGSFSCARCRQHCSRRLPLVYSIPDTLRPTACQTQSRCWRGSKHGSKPPEATSIRSANFSSRSESSAVFLTNKLTYVVRHRYRWSARLNCRRFPCFFVNPCLPTVMRVDCHRLPCQPCSALLVLPSAADVEMWVWVCHGVCVAASFEPRAWRTCAGS